MGGGVKIKTFPVLFISVILTNKKKKKMGIFDNLVFFLYNSETNDLRLLKCLQHIYINHFLYMLIFNQNIYNVFELF